MKCVLADSPFLIKQLDADEHLDVLPMPKPRQPKPKE